MFLEQVLQNDGRGDTEDKNIPYVLLHLQNYLVFLLNILLYQSGLDITFSSYFFVIC